MKSTTDNSALIPKTFTDLERISKASGIPINLLQDEYQIYEYHFASCAEAKKGYHGGYTSCIFPAADTFTPDTLAYHKGWQEISLREVTDVTKLSYDELLVFMSAMFRYGNQLLLVVEALEKYIGNDLERISKFFQGGGGNFHTFHEPGDCPVEKLAKRLCEKIDAIYRKKIAETDNKYELIWLYKEAEEYKFDEVRPLPKFFEDGLLGEKVSQQATTIEELWEDGFATLKRWRELHMKALLSDIFPTLENFLDMINRADQERWRKPHNAVWGTLSHFFDRCETIEQAKRLRDIGRGFISKENNNDPLTDGLFTPAVERIMRKKYPNPQLKDFKSIKSEAWWTPYCENECDREWREKTKKALAAMHGQKPNFGKLYMIAHKDLQLEVLDKWNERGLQFLVSVQTWNELINLKIELIPWPSSTFRNNPYYIYPESRRCFSAFIMYLTKLIETAPGAEERLKVFNYIILKMNEVGRNYSSLFSEELQIMAKKLVADYRDTKPLWGFYNGLQEKFPDCETETKSLFLDAIIERDPSSLESVFSLFKSDDKLYKKYMRMKVGQLVAP